MSSQLNLNRERMIKWGIVRGMLEACWALESSGDFKNGLEIMERFKRQLNVSAD
ncbi:hypothetical protein [Marinilactibacillus kalidii]|uniref:hypothetical protein n=1 Tax=Marinilactibacillus kalidii TaxID=2820274 RepID=UPI001ABDFD98|nr:hypothetical protein [Marinilactibacillus kalidii]